VGTARQRGPLHRLAHRLQRPARAHRRDQ
jgi:hypothetical protein